MIACLEQGDFLKLFIRFAEDDGSQVADYRWSVDESPRARHFAIRFVRMADRGRIQITLRDCTTEVETEHGLRNEMLRDALTGLPNRIAFSERLDGPGADGERKGVVWGKRGSGLVDLGGR